MGKKSVPKTPDLKPLTDAQLRIAEMSDKLAREQMGISREQFEYFKAQGLEELALARQQADRAFGLQERALASDEETRRISGQVGQAQLEAMRMNSEWAQADRRRYEQTFLPLQDRLVEEAQQYDTPERREQIAAQRMADVQRQAEASRNSADQRLRGMGIDPSQVRSTSMASQLATITAAQAAQAGNMGRTEVEERGRALRADAVNMGMGLPSQVAQGYNTSLGAGQGALGAAGAGQGATLGAINASTALGGQGQAWRQGALGSMGALTGTGLQWGQMGNSTMGMSSNSIMNAGNLMNSGFQNSMQRYQAQQDATNSMISNVTGIAGMAMGGFAEGGHVSRSAIRRQRRRYLAEGGAITIDDGPTMVDRAQGMPAGKADLPGVLPSERRQKFADALMRVSQSSAPPEGGQGFQRRPDDIQQVFYAEGGRARGALPVRQVRDKLPAMLAEGEYVVPEDVVRAKGIEFFDKLVSKYHREGA